MNKTQMGDICAVDTEGQWLIDNFIFECKAYRKLDIETGILNRRGLIFDFWRKLFRQAKGTYRQPILIAKQNNTATLIITTEEGSRLLGFYLRHPSHSLPAYHTHRLATLHMWPGTPEVYFFEALKKSEPRKVSLGE